LKRCQSAGTSRRTSWRRGCMIIESDDEFLSDLVAALSDIMDGTRTVDEVAREVCHAVLRLKVR